MRGIVLSLNYLSDIKEMRSDATILIPLKYNGDSDKGLRNLHGCCAHFSCFCFTIWQISLYTNLT